MLPTQVSWQGIEIVGVAQAHQRGEGRHRGHGGSGAFPLLQGMVAQLRERAYPVMPAPLSLPPARPIPSQSSSCPDLPVSPCLPLP